MGRTLRIAAACVVACAGTLTLAPAAAQPDISRGRALYELRCDGCHSESVHARTKRTAQDFEDVRRWVARWSVNLKLDWSAEELDDVAAHLNRTYYRYACPPTVCKVVSLR